MSGDRGNDGGDRFTGGGEGPDAAAGTGGHQPPLPPLPPMPPAPPPQPYGSSPGGSSPAWQQQPHPYGPPAPPPPAYGQQPGPYGGGAGGPAGWGVPSPPSPPPGRRGTRGALIVLAVLVLLAAGLFVIRNVVSGGSSPDASRSTDGSGRSGRPADALGLTWKAEIPQRHKLGTLGGLPALWASPRNLVYADDNGVRAFDPTTGKKLWTVATPKGASELCAAAPQPNDDGVAAVAFDAGGNDCAFLVAFDTETGRTLWSRNLAGDYPTTAPRIRVGRGSVVADVGSGIAAYSITRGGAKQWTLYARGHDCGDDGDWSGGYLVVSSSCSDAKPEHELSIRDLEFGDTYTFPGDSRDVQLVAGDRPLTVVFQGKDDKSPGSVQTYNDDTKPQKAFSLSGPLAKVEFGGRTYVDPEESVMVTSYGSTSGACAVDLKTGALLWSKDEVIPVGTDSGQVIAVTGPAEGGQSPRLASFGLRDGKERILGTLYTPDHALGPTIEGLDLSWFGSTLYVIAEDYTKPANGFSLYAFDASGKLRE